jgi:hypothetical protein
MLKTILVAMLASSAASLVMAQSAASAPAPSAAASTPKKHKYLHAPRLRPGASAAVNPEASPDKKGGQ